MENKRPRIFLFPGENEDWRVFRQRLIDGIDSDVIIMDRKKFESIVPDHSNIYSSVEDGVIIKMIKMELDQVINHPYHVNIIKEHKERMKDYQGIE